MKIFKGKDVHSCIWEHNKQIMLDFKFFRRNPMFFLLMVTDAHQKT